MNIEGILTILSEMILLKNPISALAI